MFRLPVTITRQTFQYVDMTCAGPQYGIRYCLYLLCKISNSGVIKLLDKTAKYFNIHTI
jgi:hypothetical protein